MTTPNSNTTTPRTDAVMRQVGDMIMRRETCFVPEQMLDLLVTLETELATQTALLEQARHQISILQDQVRDPQTLLTLSLQYLQMIKERDEMQKRWSEVSKSLGQLQHDHAKEIAAMRRALKIAEANLICNCKFGNVCDICKAKGIVVGTLYTPHPSDSPDLHTASGEMEIVRERNELLKDKARLDWCEKEFPDIWKSAMGWCVGEDFSCPENERSISDTLRQAIDSAIASSPEEKK